MFLKLLLKLKIRQLKRISRELYHRDQYKKAAKVHVVQTELESTLRALEVLEGILR